MFRGSFYTEKFGKSFRGAFNINMFGALLNDIQPPVLHEVSTFSGCRLPGIFKLIRISGYRICSSFKSG